MLSTPGFLYFYVQEVKDEETKQSEHYLKPGFKDSFTS